MRSAVVNESISWTGLGTGWELTLCSTVGTEVTFTHYLVNKVELWYSEGTYYAAHETADTLLWSEYNSSVLVAV